MLCKTPEQRAIWDRIEERIQTAPKNGLNAEGGYSDSIYWSQMGYIRGLRAGRLAAINATKQTEAGESR